MSKKSVIWLDDDNKNINASKINFLSEEGWEIIYIQEISDFFEYMDKNIEKIHDFIFILDVIMTIDKNKIKKKYKRNITGKLLNIRRTEIGFEIYDIIVKDYQINPKNIIFHSIYDYPMLNEYQEKFMYKPATSIYDINRKLKSIEMRSAAQ